MGRDEKQAPLKTRAWEASSPFEKVARSHARAAREKRRECEGVEKERRVLLFLLPSRSRLFLRLALLATQNREFKFKRENLSISKIKQDS